MLARILRALFPLATVANTVGGADLWLVAFVGFDQLARSDASRCAAKAAA
jgi:hypothetical protein